MKDARKLKMMLYGHPVLTYSHLCPDDDANEANKKHALVPSHPLEIEMGREWGGKWQLCYYF